MDRDGIVVWVGPLHGSGHIIQHLVVIVEVVVIVLSLDVIAGEEFLSCVIY